MSKNAYLYHFSGQSEGEIGMAIVHPIDKCIGNKKISFPKLNGNNIGYLVISNAGLSTLQFRGQPYTTYATATAVPGKPDYSLVYFEDSDIDASNPNVIESDESFTFGLAIGNGNQTGAYGFLTSFSTMKVLDPISLTSTSYYIVDTIAENQVINHSLLVESCSPPHSIVSALGSQGSVSFTDSTLTYTAPNGFCGIDEINVIVQNNNGDEVGVTLAFLINEKPVATPNSFVYIPNTPQSLDVLDDGTPDSDAIICDTIQLLSAGTNGNNMLTTGGGMVTIINNGTPNDFSDDYIDYMPLNGFIGLDTFYYVITDLYGGKDTALVSLRLAIEICENGIDDDGNGLIDCFAAHCQRKFFSGVAVGASQITMMCQVKSSGKCDHNIFFL